MWTDSQRVLSRRGTISGGVARFPRAVPVVFSLFLVCTPTHARRCPRGYKLLRTVPGPLQKIHRCPLEIISAAGRRGFEQLRRLLFALFFPPPRVSSPASTPASTDVVAAAAVTGSRSFSSSSSLDQLGEPADRTCHWSSFHPRHARLSTPWTGPTFYRDHLPLPNPHLICPLLVFPLFLLLSIDSSWPTILVLSFFVFRSFTVYSLLSSHEDWKDRGLNIDTERGAETSWRIGYLVVTLRDNSFHSFDYFVVWYGIFIHRGAIDMLMGVHFVWFLYR